MADKFTVSTQDDISDKAYIQDKDLRVGQTIQIYGRKILVCVCVCVSESASASAFLKSQYFPLPKP